jgi:hypothetical protein
MRFAHLRGVLRVPIARNGLIAAGVVTTGQFAASTFVTPFLLQTANLHTGAATVLLLGYGLAGIVGTLLLGSGPVARTPVVGQTDGLWSVQFDQGDAGWPRLCVSPCQTRPKGVTPRLKPIRDRTIRSVNCVRRAFCAALKAGKFLAFQPCLTVAAQRSSS